MRRSVLVWTLAAAACILGGALLAPAAQETKGEPGKKAKEVWTDPRDPQLPADFAIQGEYLSDRGEAMLGCQIIALGGGQFQAVVLPGGLPGAGWDGKQKSLMEGQLDGDKAVFKPAMG